MRFTKGFIIGSVLTAGTMMMYTEGITSGKKRMLKIGKQMIKKRKKDVLAIGKKRYKNSNLLIKS